MRTVQETERKYAFDDLIALRVARELREAGSFDSGLGARVVSFLRDERGPSKSASRVPPYCGWI